jgi:pimeloyl-ACP methyl ester carboxylesterase
VLAADPGRFERVVLYLPAALDESSAFAVRRATDLAAALRARDAAGVEAFVRAELPDVPGIDPYVAQRTAYLLSSDLVPLLEALQHDPPVPHASVLERVEARVLVVAERDDPVHPLEVGEALVAAVPGARLEVLGRGALWSERARLRTVISGFLDGPSGATAVDQAGDAGGA